MTRSYRRQRDRRRENRDQAAAWEPEIRRQLPPGVTLRIAMPGPGARGGGPHWLFDAGDGTRVLEWWPGSRTTWCRAARRSGMADGPGALVAQVRQSLAEVLASGEPAPDDPDRRLRIATPDCEADPTGLAPAPPARQNPARTTPREGPMRDDDLTVELREIEATAALLGELTPAADLDAGQLAEVRERVARALADLEAASEIVANAVDVVPA